MDGCKSRGRSKKRWMDCVKDDMARKEVSDEIRKKERKKNIYFGQAQEIQK